ncbi:Short repeat of unknown function [Treponema bryantii]|uniref:DUF308 domain-containing protein n=1 Tax=Treponema bryantii TaxID=163 RepID=A0A1H9G2F7_9SPIR|nr:DUF308 domain-containing protein [Treponema bryantii]SEQ44324.1 Short repeat of unknown function [Treponema bryantii]
MKRWYLFSGILAALLGLLVIIFPAFWIKLVVVIIGLAAIGYGIYSLKFTKVISDDAGYRKTILIKSIVSIVAGAMAVLFPLAIGGAAWSAMIWVLIFYLLLSGAAGFYAAALLKDSGVERKRYIIENLLLLAVAVVLILISPRSLGNAIIRLIGIIVLVGGLCLILFDVFSNRNVVEGEVVEVKDDSVSAKEDSVEKNETDSENGE